MDEPTSALDFKNQTIILRMINKLARQGITVILSTHFPNHALLYSCKVAMMNRGGFIAFGPSKDVITEENLKHTYGLEVRIFTAENPGSNEPVRFCIPAEETASGILDAI